MNDKALAYWNRPSWTDQQELIAGPTPWSVSEQAVPAHAAAIETTEIQAYLSTLDQPTVVEIGCGVGRLLRHWKNYRTIGVDVSPNMIARAREYLAGAPNIVALHVTDGATLPLEDESADFIYAFLVFQHLNQTQIDSYVREVARVLKPDGYFRIQTMKGIPYTGEGFGRWHGRYYENIADLIADITNSVLILTATEEGVLFPEWLWATVRKTRGGSH